MKYRFQNVRPNDEKAAYSGIEFYRGILIEKFSKIQYYDLWDLRTKRVISEAIVELNLVDREINEKKDIINTYNSAINHIASLLLSEIEKYKKESLLSCLYTLAAYMFEMQSYINLVGDERFTIEKIQQKATFNQNEELILMIADFVKSAGKEFYLNLSNGEDKAIIQHIILIATRCVHRGSKIISFNDLFKIFDLAASIVYLINDREMLTSEFNESLRVTSEGFELNEGKINENFYKIAYNLNECSTSLDSIIDRSTLELLEDNLLKSLGFKLSTIKKMIKNEGSSGTTAERYALVHLLPKKKLIELVQKEGICSKCEAEKIMEYFALKQSDDKEVFKSFDKLSSRIFENPILQYNDNFYLYSNTLMIAAHEILYNKLVYNLLPECWGDNSTIIEEAIKKGFEKETYSLISKYLNHSEYDVQDMEIVIDGVKRRIHLDKQIDLWAMKESTLFIFECKDICTKYTFTGFRNDIVKTKKFIFNLYEKVKEITNKKLDIQTYLNCNISSIIPVLIFRNYNVSIHSEMNKRDIIIIPFQNLENWLKNL